MFVRTGSWQPSLPRPPPPDTHKKHCVKTLTDTTCTALGKTLANTLRYCPPPPHTHTHKSTGQNPGHSITAPPPPVVVSPPQSLRHNSNGRFVTVCGDGEYVIYTALAWRNKSFGRWVGVLQKYPSLRKGGMMARTCKALAPILAAKGVLRSSLNHVTVNVSVTVSRPGMLRCAVPGGMIACVHNGRLTSCAVLCYGVLYNPPLHHENIFMCPAVRWSLCGARRAATTPSVRQAGV